MRSKRIKMNHYEYYTAKIKTWQNEEILHYIAGLTDGEAHFGIHGYAQPVVTITNTCHSLLHALRDYVDLGSIDEANNRWLFHRPVISAFIELLRPHLIVKYAQADLMSRYVVEAYREGNTGNKGLSDETVKLRQKFTAEFKRLNKDFLRSLEFTDRISPAWLAGFIDAEAHIGFARQSGKPFTAVLSITNSVLAILSAIDKMLEVTCSYDTANGDGAINFAGQNACSVLEIVEPYILMKSKRITLVKRFIHETMNPPGSSLPLGITRWQLRYDLDAEMAPLTKRGENRLPCE